MQTSLDQTDGSRVSSDSATQAIGKDSGELLPTGSTERIAGPEPEHSVLRDQGSQDVDELEPAEHPTVEPNAARTSMAPVLDQLELARSERSKPGVDIVPGAGSVASVGYSKEDLKSSAESPAKLQELVRPINAWIAIVNDDLHRWHFPFPWLGHLISPWSTGSLQSG